MGKWQPIPCPLCRDLKSIHRCGPTYGVYQWAVDTPTSTFSTGPERGAVAPPSGPSTWPDLALLAPCRHGERPHQWGFSIFST